MSDDDRRAAFRKRFPDLAPTIEALAALYGPGRVKLVCAITKDGDEIGKVDQAFRDAARATWNAPPVIVPEEPKRRRK